MSVVSLSTVVRIAANVFKESVRDKVLYSIVLFAVLIISASLLLGQLTAGQEVKIIKDLGLSAISLFGHFIAIFIGIGLVSKEVERRSIYALLAKPMSRTELLLGKFFGLVATLAVNVAVMTAALVVVLAVYAWLTPADLRASWESSATDPAIVVVAGMILAELAVVTAIAILFSTFTSPVLAAAFTVGLVIAGQFGADLKNFEQVVESAPVAWMARGLYYVLPNLAPFDVKSQYVHAQSIPAGYVALTTGYAALYVAALLTLAALFFSRRDFK
jgi:ABC-type transport system involved in multi-copper enzyme maturation permease subunit